MKKNSVLQKLTQFNKETGMQTNLFIVINTVARIRYAQGQPGVCQPRNVKFIWSNVEFKASVSLLIFCQDDLSIHR